MSNTNIPKITWADGTLVEDQDILEPYYHLATPQRGKLSDIVPAFNCWFKAPEEIVEKSVLIAELLAETFYLVDDIEDGCALRRGQPAAHIVYGMPRTLSCANYLQSIVFDHVLALDHPQAMQVYVKQLQETQRCLAKEVYYRETFQCPTEQQYFKAIIPWYDMPVQICQLHSDDKRNVDKLLKMLSLLSQMKNDYLNLTSGELWKKKTHCQDLTEGKFSYPIIHAVQSNHPDSEKVVAILKQKTADEEVKRYCLTLMENIGSFEYARKGIQKMEQDVMDEIKNLGGNPEIEAFVHRFAKLELEQ